MAEDLPPFVVDPMQHQGFLWWFIRRYQRKGIPFREIEDLFQEGQLGLLAACRRYDPARGVTFTSYAKWWIRAAITARLRSSNWPVRVPTWACKILEEGAPMGELPPETLESLPLARAALELKPMDGDFDAAAEARDRLETLDLETLLAALTPIEAEVIRQRYGLDGNGGARLCDVSARLGLGRWWVAKLEARALCKMRAMLLRGEIEE